MKLRGMAWAAAGLHCSANERRADEASRDVEAWLKCYYIKNKLGEEFTGSISGVTQFGIFVQLDSLYIEGLVHVTDLGADYFQYDDARHELRGERTGKRYQLTDRVNVQVSRVDLDARKIDLCLVQPGGVRGSGNGKPGPGANNGGAVRGSKSAKGGSGAVAESRGMAGQFREAATDKIVPSRAKVAHGTGEGKPARVIKSKAGASTSKREKSTAGRSSKGSVASTKVVGKLPGKTSLKKRKQ